MSLLVQSRAYIQAAKTRAAPPLPVVLLLLVQILELQRLLLLQGLLPIQALLCQALQLLLWPLWLTPADAPQIVPKILEPLLLTHGSMSCTQEAVAAKTLLGLSQPVSQAAAACAVAKVVVLGAEAVAMAKLAVCL